MSGRLIFSLIFLQDGYGEVNLKLKSLKSSGTFDYVDAPEATDSSPEGKQILRKRDLFIMKTSLYNFDPLKPHFYIVKLAFTGVYLFFLFLLKNIDCGYSLELPHRGSSNEYPQSMF